MAKWNLRRGWREYCWRVACLVSCLIQPSLVINWPSVGLRSVAISLQKFYNKITYDERNSFVLKLYLFLLVCHLKLHITCILSRAVDFQNRSQSPSSWQHDGAEAAANKPMEFPAVKRSKIPLQSSPDIVSQENLDPAQEIERYNFSIVFFFFLWKHLDSLLFWVI